MRGLVVTCLAAWPASAGAEHSHHEPPDRYAVLDDGDHHHGDPPSYGASLGVVLASYDAPRFAGDYQGTNVGGWWRGRRFGIAASLPAYRLTKNGRTVEGLGDLMLHAQTVIVATERWSLDVMMMASAPTGDDREGLGMGDAMLMPEVGAHYTAPRFMIGARAGVGYMTGGETSHAEHGQAMWPLVAPMNAQELTGAVDGLVALAPTLATGLRVQGAIPIGDGANRLVAGGRVVWIAGRAQTSFGIEAGLAGAPFGFRGLVETAVRFD